MTRQTRSEETRQERRRRSPEGLAGTRKKLFVDENDLDREKYAYRWINDDGARVHNMTQLDDWDIVDSSDKRFVDRAENGSPIKGVLVRKPINYQKEDDAAKQRQIDETEKAIADGGSADGEQADGSYVPGERALTIG